MKHSIIFSYRNREEHLNIILPQIHKVFADKDFEVIIAEQNDDRKFRRANLLNEGAKVATGDLLIFHDIDYYPTDNVEYYDGVSDVFLPVRKVLFVMNDLSERPMYDVPGGYRHFKDGVDLDFFGGVEVFKHEAFFKINGFSWEFVGWGLEDVDLRHRIAIHNLTVNRHPSNQFLALDHKDSGPAHNDPDFQRNIQLAGVSGQHLDWGVTNQPSHVEIVESPHPLVHKWLKCSKFTNSPQDATIKTSSFLFD